MVEKRGEEGVRECKRIQMVKGRNHGKRVELRAKYRLVSEEVSNANSENIQIILIPNFRF
jgi:hypothetical protein